MAEISNMEDTLDVRDIISRIEELESELSDSDLTAHVPGVSDDVDEYHTLKSLMDDMKGYGGDEQWRGDWYPVTLIRDSYFETAMDELLEDIGDLKPFDKIPSYLKITVDYDALQSDYTSVEYDGVTYWYR